jgi:ribonuclease HII
MLVRERARHVEIEIAPAAVVDAHARRGALNVLERQMAAALLDRGPAAHRILADGARLFAPLRDRYPQLSARDRADAAHTVVAAASILAKVERDRRFQRIAARCGDLADDARQGMGYVNAATERFLRAYWERHGRLPPATRASWDWAPLRRLTDRQLPLPLR